MNRYDRIPANRDLVRMNSHDRSDPNPVRPCCIQFFHCPQDDIVTLQSQPLCSLQGFAPGTNPGYLLVQRTRGCIMSAHACFHRVTTTPILGLRTHFPSPNSSKRRICVMASATSCRFASVQLTHLLERGFSLVFGILAYVDRRVDSKDCGYCVQDLNRWEIGPTRSTLSYLTSGIIA